VGRLIAIKLSERLGKQVVVENRGGSTIIGTEMVAKANPDGYTLLFTGASHTTSPALEKVPYDPIKSFVPVANVGNTPHAMVVHPGFPAKSVKELIALAKQKPGEIIWATGGLASSPHMATERFQIMADIKFKVVHFKGAGPALVDVLGGHSNGMISSLAGLIHHIQAGKLRAIGTSGKTRCFLLPDVPTIDEGGLPGYVTITWKGLLAPAGTPAPIITRLANEIEAAVATDEVKNMLAQEGATPAYLGPAEFRLFLEEDLRTWADVVKKANIKLEER
jgi:tripartite-type tricarboxylate transporter receptor subunit TctC